MKPRCVSIFPTNRCNARCYYCAYQTNYALADAEALCRKGDALNRDLLLKFMDELPVNNIEISGGGEPLAHPDFAWFAGELVARNIGAKLITNGILLDGPAAEAAAKLSYIELSVNYWDHRSFAETRGLPEFWFDIVTANIMKLARSRPSCVLGAKVVLTSRNYPSLQKIREYLMQFGITRLVVTPGYSRDPKEVPPPEVFGRDRLARAKPKCLCCQRQLDHPVVGADGHIYACCYFTYVPGMRIGNLAAQKLADVLDNPVFDQGLCAKVEQVITDYRNGVVTAFP